MKDAKKKKSKKAQVRTVPDKKYAKTFRNSDIFFNNSNVEMFNSANQTV